MPETIDIRTFDAAVQEFATQHAGVIASWHLAALGVSRQSVCRRVRAGRLVRLHRGVYAVGHGALSPKGRALAAAWACGPAAVLSHQAAADHWGILASNRAVWDVTVPGRSRRGPKRVCVHTANLHPDDLAEHEDIPVTSIARTLLDLGSAVNTRRLKRAIEQADRAELLDLNAIEPLLERTRGHKGRAKLISALELYRGQPPFTRSETELRLYRLCEQNELPKPSMNANAGPYEVDACWHDHGLIVEVDTYGTHGDRASFERDRERDLELGELGYEVIRVTDRMLHGEPGRVVRRLRRKLL